jgi:hypothetical protein
MADHDGNTKKLLTRDYRIAAIALLVFGIALALVYHELKSRSDITDHGLDPNRPGFKPVVVILSGTTSNGYFQIRMRGADYYYCRKWNKHRWEAGSWFTMELDISPDVAFGWGLHCNGFGSGGGGGFSAGLPNDLVLARRLWNGTNFIGANTNELIAEERRWDRKEEFQKLEKVGPYLIPKQIKFSNFNSSDRNRKVETYTILQVEFSDEPSTNWFLDVKRKYYDHSLTTDLDEPGPFLGERKIFGIFPAP